jgi:hypothetical protein
MLDVKLRDPVRCHSVFAFRAMNAAPSGHMGRECSGKNIGKDSPGILEIAHPPDNKS